MVAGKYLLKYKNNEIIQSKNIPSDSDKAKRENSFFLNN